MKEIEKFNKWATEESGESDICDIDYWEYSLCEAARLGVIDLSKYNKEIHESAIFHGR